MYKRVNKGKLLSTLFTPNPDKEVLEAIEKSNGVFIQQSDKSLYFLDFKGSSFLEIKLDLKNAENIYIYIEEKE